MSLELINMIQMFAVIEGNLFLMPVTAKEQNIFCVR